MSSPNLENFKNEFDSIKSEIGASNNEIVSSTNVENNLIFDDNEKGDYDDGVLLLGELLKFLRENKELSCLMICRRIHKVEIADNVAHIDIQDDLKKELAESEKYQLILNTFFKSKNLDYKFNEKIVEESDLDKLKLIFGEKLIIKHTKNV